MDACRAEGGKPRRIGMPSKLGGRLRMGSKHDTNGDQEGGGGDLPVWTGGKFAPRGRFLFRQGTIRGAPDPIRSALCAGSFGTKAQEVGAYS